jgi:hypothetical protein
MTSRKKSRTDHVEELSVGERLAFRKRARTQATMDTLPPFLFLEGLDKTVGDRSFNYEHGKLYVDLQSRRVGFQPSGIGLPSRTLDPHPFSK